MRSLLLLCLILLTGCKQAGEVSTGRSTASGPKNPDAPFIWKNKTFPKAVRISSSFTADEVAAIKNMGDAWKSAVDNRAFFLFGEPTNNNHNIEKPDGVMGIYKTTNWPSDVDDEALAITQLFGRRYNLGDPDEYVGVEHADILVNYKPGPYAFEFNILDGVDDDNDSKTSDEEEGYDLQTVVLHEMGHFLGLGHIPSWYDLPWDEQDKFNNREEYKATSVMYPSINSSERKRTPTALDVDEILMRYPASYGTMAATAERYRPKEEDPGANVRIVLELRKDGECIHKENGVIFKRHSVKLKKRNQR